MADEKPILSWEQADQIMQEQRAEIICLREKENAMLAAGDRLENQLIAVARQRDAMRLTTEERESIEIVADWAEDHLGEDDPGVVALRSMLERTK